MPVACGQLGWRSASSPSQSASSRRCSPASSMRFMAAAEKPLLDVVLRHAEGNQSRAADWLGINRNTLRRKLRDHRLAK